MRVILCVLLVGLVALPALSAPTVDGTKDAGYGSALSVQTVQTQFGDNFSEWNAAYAVCQDDKLFLMLTGNLEANFNKLEIFIDSKAGGQSVFSSAGNDGSGNMNGLVFDTGFTADYHLIARRGNSKFDLDFADLGAPAFTFHENVFGGTDSGSGTTGTGTNAVGIMVGYDGSNTGGVTGGDQAADQNAALAVTTGLELGIALSDLGYTAGDPIRIMVGQNNQGHDFWSNQFLGGLAPPQGNLGSPGAKDFTTFAGEQFFTACPEPGSLALAGLALIGVAMSGRRRK